jgi:hypothetical protein
MGEAKRKQALTGEAARKHYEQLRETALIILHARLSGGYAGCDSFEEAIAEAEQFLKLLDAKKPI